MKNPLCLDFFRKSAIFFTGIFFLFIVGCATFNTATGRREFIMIPTSMEVDMGRSLHSQIVKEYGLSTKKDLEVRVRQIGQKLAAISDRQDYVYNFYVVEKKEVNAFTIPGGSIYVFSGLLDKIPSDDAIAAVIGHEIGHCAARHTVKKFQASMGYNLIGALVLSQVNMGESARATAQMASDVGMNLALSAYSRQDEYEADRLAIKYMYLAGYDLNGMIQTLEALQKESKGPQGPLLLRSHPYLEDRLNAVKEEIAIAARKYGQK